MRAFFTLPVCTALSLPIAAEADGGMFAPIKGKWAYTIGGGFLGDAFGGLATEVGIIKVKGDGNISAKEYADVIATDLSTATIQGESEYICDPLVKLSQLTYRADCSRFPDPTAGNGDFFPNGVEISFVITVGNDTMKFLAISNSGPFGVVDVSGEAVRAGSHDDGD